VFQRSSAINAAAYGLVAWHFLTSAGLMLGATAAFVFQGRLEALATGGSGAFLGYVGVVFLRRFAAEIRGDNHLRF
jgi:hypothetical protein